MEEKKLRSEWKQRMNGPFCRALLAFTVVGEGERDQSGGGSQTD